MILGGPQFYFIIFRAKITPHPPQLYFLALGLAKIGKCLYSSALVYANLYFKLCSLHPSPLFFREFVYKTIELFCLILIEIGRLTNIYIWIKQGFAKLCKTFTYHCKPLHMVKWLQRVGIIWIDRWPYTKLFCWLPKLFWSSIGWN